MPVTLVQMQFLPADPQHMWEPVPGTRPRMRMFLNRAIRAVFR